MDRQRYGWMEGQMDKWMDRWINGWTNGWMGVWVDGYTYKSSLSHTNEGYRVL